MNNKKAIRLLEQQKAKLRNTNNCNDAWVAQTKSYISSIFGEESSEYKYLENFTFKVLSYSSTPESQKKRQLNVPIFEVDKFIDNCIETVKTNRTNITNRKDCKLLNFYFLLPFAIAMISIGFYFGKEKVNRENINLIQENKALYLKVDTLQKKVETLSLQIDSIN